MPRDVASPAPQPSIPGRVVNKVRYLARTAVARLAAHAIEIRDERARPSPDQVILHPRETVEIDLSRYRYLGPRPYWMDFGPVELDAAFTLSLPGAEIVREGIVIDPGGRVVLESAIFQRYYLDRLRRERELLLRPVLPAQRMGRVICLSNHLENNYYHWVMESLARLAVLPPGELAGRQVVIRDGAPRFERETIEFLFGLAGDRAIEQRRARARTDECLVVSFPHTRNDTTRWTNTYRPAVLRRLNALALERVAARGGGGTRGDGTGRNIIISRAGARGRAILNEQRLVDRFPHLALEVVRPETMSFAEQVALFADARLVIGTHGAGLTNLLFARSPVVIELFPATRTVRDAFYFAQISAALGFRHTAIEYVPANDEQDLVLTDAHLLELERVLDEVRIG